VLGADILSFQEFMTKEPLPLATIQAAVFEFLRDRDDVVVFGAQAEVKSSIKLFASRRKQRKDFSIVDGSCDNGY